MFDVTGVAADDVLNIRDGAASDTPIVGRLAPDAVGVEVIYPSVDGKWGRINVTETTGWVSLRFLERQPYQEAFSYPSIGHCYGNEPFWGFRTDGESAQLSTPEGTLMDGLLQDGSRSENRIDTYGLAAGDNTGSVTGVLRREICTDGMSDRVFGLSLTLIYVGTNGHRTLSGCCTLR